MTVMHAAARRADRRPPRASAALLLLLAACAPDRAPEGGTASADAAAPSAEAAGTAGLDASAVATEPSPRETVLDALAAFRDVRSFHADMRVEGGPQGTVTTEMQFVHPDRWRMDMQAGGQALRTVRIGDEVWMDMGGRLQKTTMPPGSMDQWQDLVARGQETMTAEFLGVDALDGRPTRRYRLRQSEPEPSEVTVWIGDDGLPVRAVVEGEMEGRGTTTTIRYSRFNDPGIRIEPPS